MEPGHEQQQAQASARETTAPSLQYRIVSGTLGVLGRLLSQPLLRRLAVYAVYALIGVVVTMMFVRNYSDPTNPEEIHRHAGEFPGPHLSGLNARQVPDGTFKGMVTGTCRTCRS